MALVWSSGSGASNPHYVGMDITRSGKTVSCDYWVKATYPVEDSQTLNRLVNGGSVGTVDYFKSGPAAVKVSTRSFTGTANTTYTLRAYLSGVYNSGAPDLSLTVTIPPDVPAAPTGLTITRVSDTQHTVAWTNNATSAAPYANVVVERWMDEGSYAAVATLGGAVASYSATTSADHKYSFRVKATNSAGSSSYAYSPDFTYTTPAAPTIGGATKVGSDIQVTWDHTARWPTGAKVYASQDGGAYSLLATIGTTAETYTHPSPSTAVTWTYKVAATNGSLESALSSASNTVLLLAAPNAPTLLAPTVADAAEAIAFEFQHNPVDTTGLTAFELQRRPSGGSWTTVSTGATNVSGNVWRYTLTAGTLTNGRTYEWQVRTKGSHATFSPYSALGSFPTSARPTGTINTPTTTHGESTLTVQWGYYDAEGTAQAQWRATLTNGATTEVLSGSGTATEATFATVLPDASTWDVTVEVRDGAGLWSVPDTVTFTADYAPPPTPVLTALYNANTGSASVAVSNPATEPGEVDAVTNMIYRALDGAEAWATLLAAQASAAARGLTEPRVNYALNPAANGSGVGFAAYGGSAAEPGVLSWETGSGPEGLTTFGRWTVTTARTTTSVGWQALTAQARAPLVGQAGDAVTFSLWMRYTGTDPEARVYMRGYFYDAAGGIVNYDTKTTPYTLPSGEWVRVSHTVTATGDYDSLGFWAYQTGTTYGQILPAGATMDATGLMYEVGASLRDYFDGSTPDTADTTYSWEGTPDASASVMADSLVPAALADLDTLTWTLIATDLPLGGSMTDPIPTVGGTTLYKAVAVSATPSTAESPTAGIDTRTFATHQGWCFANWGPGFVEGVRLRAGVTTNASTSRDKVLQHYSDREDPVEYAGTARYHSIAISARLAPTISGESTWDELEALADLPAPVCWRDPTGRRVFGSTGPVGVSSEGIEQVGTVTLTRTDHRE